MSTIDDITVESAPKLKVDEIKHALRRRNVSFGGKDKKAELVEHLIKELQKESGVVEVPKTIEEPVKAIEGDVAPTSPQKDDADTAEMAVETPDITSPMHGTKECVGDASPGLQSSPKATKENEKLTKQELTDLLVGHGESLKALKALTRPKLIALLANYSRETDNISSTVTSEATEAVVEQEAADGSAAASDEMAVDMGAHEAVSVNVEEQEAEDAPKEEAEVVVDGEDSHEGSGPSSGPSSDPNPSEEIAATAEEEVERRQGEEKGDVNSVQEAEREESSSSSSQSQSQSQSQPSEENRLRELVLKQQVARSLHVKTNSSSLNSDKTSVRIDHFQRPLNTKALQAWLSEKTGVEITDENFWINPIKTHCYLDLVTPEAARACVEAVTGQKFPPASPFTLVAGLTAVSAAAASMSPEAGMKAGEWQAFAASPRGRAAISATNSPRTPGAGVGTGAGSRTVVLDNALASPSPRLGSGDEAGAGTGIALKGAGPLGGGAGGTSSLVGQSPSPRGLAGRIGPPMDMLRRAAASAAESALHANDRHNTLSSPKGMQSAGPGTLDGAVAPLAAIIAVKSLDELFKKTVATPPLYWLPVGEAEVSRRQRLAAASKGQFEEGHGPRGRGFAERGRQRDEADEGGFNQPPRKLGRMGGGGDAGGVGGGGGPGRRGDRGRGGRGGPWIPPPRDSRDRDPRGPARR